MIVTCFLLDHIQALLFVFWLSFNLVIRIGRPIDDVQREPFAYRINDRVTLFVFIDKLALLGWTDV